MKKSEQLSLITKGPNDDSFDPDAEEAALDAELAMVQKLKLAFAASLHMLEVARDDLVTMNCHMDQFKRASEILRQALDSKKAQDQDGSIPTQRTD